MLTKTIKPSAYINFISPIVNKPDKNNQD